MDLEQLIQRINALAKKSKEEGLTEEEKAEQKDLRHQYLENFRSNFKEQIENIKVVDEKGDDVTPQKIKDLRDQREQSENKEN